MTLIKQPLKYSGGKKYLTETIHRLAPSLGSYIHRVIPFCGGTSESWNWPYDNISECWNDIDASLTNFYRVLQDETAFAAFKRKVEAIPFSQSEFWLHQGILANAAVNNIDYAVAFFVVCRQSYSGIGKSFTPLTKTRTRSNQNAETSAWWNSIEGLADVHFRLRRVVVLNEDALITIKTQDSPSTFQYLDPTYVSSTVSGPLYKYTMNDGQHESMLKLVNNCESKFLISGYECQLYNDYLKLPRWKVHKEELSNSMSKADKKQKMTECLWYNYE